MTVAELEAKMPNSEFIEWSMFYAQRAAEAEVEEKMARNRR